MKKIFLSLVLFGCLSNAYSQKTEKDEVVDTTSATSIEKMLRQTSIVKKVEFVEIEKVKVVQFQIIIVTNLKTGAKTKGLYLSNKSGVNIWTGVTKYERHAYLDENEIDDLILFLEDCDRRWKNETPALQTQYHFETLDNLRITFWTKKNSNSWIYEVKFSNYIYDNTEQLGKSQSDELLNALKQVKSELSKY